ARLTRSASPRSTNGAVIGRYSRIMAEAERLRQSLLADAGRGDLLKTIIDRVELRPNGLRMLLSLVPLTPAAAPPNRLQGGVFTREFPLRIKRRGVEMRVAIDAPDPRATNPDPVLLKEVKRARRCFDALGASLFPPIGDAPRPRFGPIPLAVPERVGARPGVTTPLRRPFQCRSRR